ncbi:hypothetical protein K469DRAFT_752085 [Zopfia rhizophila CBS 207.26]|uniref:C2H2-type domain-containing protein n=1 Tax=Zopfia rhizophila CBS 207.26 TaxID=1314779 RepID=A0A6A6DY87_9PEZI|nr:hypothetical protein K469DRAFT_752085 [Zopfia rhizophila CBS 207.26]
MTGRHTRFVPFDPSKAQKTGRIDGTVMCQTCFEPFDTSRALRNHVGDFQLEVQRLMARMLEAQAHLPLLDNQYHAASDCNGEACDGNNDDGGDDCVTDNDEDDDGDDDDAGSGDCSLGLEDHARLQCPYPGCDRKKQFKRRQDLVRHYQSHIRCYEICVICRDSFSRVRPFLRHQCIRKNRKNDKTKEFYMRERCAQLRRYATKRLDQVLAWDKKSHERTKKRGHEEVDGCSESHPPSKTHMATVDGNADPWFLAENDLLGNDPPSNMSHELLIVCVHRRSISKQCAPLHATNTNIITLKQVCNSGQQLIQYRVIDAIPLLSHDGKTAKFLAWVCADL